MASAAAAKVKLTDHQSATVAVPLDDGSISTVTLSREELDSIAQPLLLRIWEAMQRAGGAVFLEWAGRCP
jgi:molecular chaperone DnaK (HSP70)